MVAFLYDICSGSEGLNVILVLTINLVPNTSRAFALLVNIIINQVLKTLRVDYSCANSRTANSTCRSCCATLGSAVQCSARSNCVVIEKVVDKGNRSMIQSVAMSLLFQDCVLYAVAVIV
jgi:hypothetical protein